MKTTKKIITMLLTLCLLIYTVGCAEKYEEYDNFEPACVEIVDNIEGEEYKTVIDDADYAKKMLDAFKKLNINTQTEGEMGTSYLNLCFYDENLETKLVFTIYENGACCLGEDYEDFYTVTNGRQAYIDLCELYTAYKAD